MQDWLPSALRLSTWGFSILHRMPVISMHWNVIFMSNAIVCVLSYARRYSARILDFSSAGILRTAETKKSASTVILLFRLLWTSTATIDSNTLTSGTVSVLWKALLSDASSPYWNEYLRRAAGLYSESVLINQDFSCKMSSWWGITELRSTTTLPALYTISWSSGYAARSGTRSVFATSVLQSAKNAGRSISASWRRNLCKSFKHSAIDQAISEITSKVHANKLICASELNIGLGFVILVCMLRTEYRLLKSAE